MEKELQFCRGCWTPAAWRPGGLCPTCMLGEKIENADYSHSFSTPRRQPSTNPVAEMLGGVIGFMLVIAFIAWLFSQGLNIPDMFNSKEELDNLFGNDEGVASMVIALCATMYDNGIRVIHIGGLMRMLGVSNKDAQKHDHECFELGDHFYEQIEEMGFEKLEEHALHLNVNDTVH